MNGNKLLPELDLNRLRFRRQFILGPRAFLPNTWWSCTPLQHNFVLSTHCDLPLYQEKNGKIFVTLLGLAFDPDNPEFDETKILAQLVSTSDNLQSLIRNTETLSGRWVIIFQDSDTTYLFSDPFGFRTIFYYSDGENVWCASQPELIGTQQNLVYSSEINLLEYIHSTEFSRKESPLFGFKTIYRDCFHLLPNHYLNLRSACAVRFSADDVSVIQKPREAVIEDSSELLRRILVAITNRQTTAMALTSGWDSRLLLAASCDVRSKISYFVDRKGILPENHPDVWVPRALSEKLGLNLEVRSSEIDLPGWFFSLLSSSVTGARALPKSRMIYSKYLNLDHRVYLNGNGGEIFRNYYDKTCSFIPEKMDIVAILRVMGFEKPFTFLTEEIEKWIGQINLPISQKGNILDYLYWEQRIGNWGAQFPSEQDIAVEELSPLNCRLLIKYFLSTSREDRSAPNYPIVRDVILRLWPQVLDLPINPPTQLGPSQSIKKRLSKILKTMGSGFKRSS